MSFHCPPITWCWDWFCTEMAVAYWKCSAAAQTSDTVQGWIRDVQSKGICISWIWCLWCPSGSFPVRDYTWWKYILLVPLTMTNNKSECCKLSNGFCVSSHMAQVRHCCETKLTCSQRMLTLPEELGKEIRIAYILIDVWSIEWLMDWSPISEHQIVNLDVANDKLLMYLGVF